MTDSDSGRDLLDTYRTAPMKFPLHVVDEDGEALCGNLAGKQERFIERNGTDMLPTVEEKRDGEAWHHFLTGLCANCRRSLLAEIDHCELHDGWEEHQRRIGNDDSEVPA